MLKISAGPVHSWDVDYHTTDSITLTGQPFLWDVLQVGEGRYHILHNSRSYSAEFVHADYDAKVFILKINGQRMELQAKDRFDQLLQRMGLGDATTIKVNELKAPMPGLIIDIRVELGQVVRKGDAVLVLEAMKMENILKAPADGTIDSIKVALRANVNKGQLLVQFT